MLIEHHLLSGHAEIITTVCDCADSLPESLDRDIIAWFSSSTQNVINLLKSMKANDFRCNSV